MNTLTAGDVVVRASEAADVAYLAPRLRESDKLELWAAAHETPEKALADGLAASTTCYTITHKGEPVAMFGVTPAPWRPGCGCGWLLATPGLVEVKTRFLRLSRRFITELLQDYEAIFNFVDERNTASIKWLKWCGAAFGPSFIGGAEGLPFKYFEIRRTHV